MTKRFAAVLSACLLGFAANAAAQHAEASRVYNIRFDGYCDGMEITVTGNYAAGRPTGCAVGQGVAVGMIGRPLTGTSRVLALGQNLNDENNFVGMFLISYPLTNGGTAQLIATRNGRTIANAGTNTYSMGKPRATRSAKSFLSKLQPAE